MSNLVAAWACSGAASCAEASGDHTRKPAGMAHETAAKARRPALREAFENARSNPRRIVLQSGRHGRNRGQGKQDRSRSNCTNATGLVGRATKTPRLGPTPLFTTAA